MSHAAALAEWVWHGTGVGPATLRSALAPFSAVYAAEVVRRNRRFDAGVGVLPVALPSIGVGNLTVGGTGKTPVAAWCARELVESGAAPAIVLRGYGDDEWRVHALLNPDVPVIPDADRVRGIATAASKGADCAVLDDAFQHRRASRLADLVLVAADAWTGHLRPLPAGPWREPLSALQRASVAVITVKAASAARVSEVEAAIRRAAPGIPVAIMGIVPSGLRAVVAKHPMGATVGAAEPLSVLQHRRVTALSAIGQPEAFERQLAALGAIVRPQRFRDHHPFTAADVAQVRRAAAGDDLVVCTLKDAVKLAPLWHDAAPPLWYVSQTIEVRLGRDALHDALARVLSARNLPRADSRPTAG